MAPSPQGRHGFHAIPSIPCCPFPSPCLPRELRVSSFASGGAKCQRRPSVTHLTIHSTTPDPIQHVANHTQPDRDTSAWGWGVFNTSGNLSRGTCATGTPGDQGPIVHHLPAACLNSTHLEHATHATTYPRSRQHDATGEPAVRVSALLPRR